VIATDEVGSAHVQIIKLMDGTDGGTDRIQGTAANGLEVDVTRLPALAAGTNNIGDVDVLTLPALAAGTNNIGDVDVLTLPAIPAGTNNIGDVDVASIAAGDNNIGNVDVVTLPALPAGTNNIGDVDVLTLPALPAGTNNIGDVDVLSVVPGTGATSLGKAEDAVHSSGDTGVMALAVRSDAGTAFGADGDYVPFSVDSSGAVRVTGGGGGTQYTEGDTDASITGTAMLHEVAADTLATISTTNPLPVSDNGTTLSIDDGGGVITVDGTVTANLAAGTNNIGDVDVLSVVPGTGATNLGKAEDAAHTGGDVGVMALAVRNDTPGSLAGTDLDYAPLQLDSTGALRVTGGGGGTQYQEDAAHSSGDTGTMALMVRQDTQSALAGTTGDYLPGTTDAVGSLRVVGGGYTDVISGTLTRPANTTAYTAEDEVGTNSTSPLSLNLARYNAATGYITSATLIYSSNPTVTPQFRLIITDQTVTLAGDNAALALSDADAAKAIGFIDFFAVQAGATGTSGATIYKGSMSEPIPFEAGAATQAIFFTLITKIAFTPIANSETIEVRIGVELN
jgi:hypothetical protein